MNPDSHRRGVSPALPRGNRLPPHPAFDRLGSNPASIEPRHLDRGPGGGDRTRPPPDRHGPEGGQRTVSGSILQHHLLEDRPFEARAWGRSGNRPQLSGPRALFRSTGRPWDGPGRAMDTQYRDGRPGERAGQSDNPSRGPGRGLCLGPAPRRGQGLPVEPHEGQIRTSRVSRRRGTHPPVPGREGSDRL